MRMSTAQLQYISPALRDSYKKYCKKNGLKQNIIKLETGTEAYWIGSPKAKNIVIYFHGSCISCKAFGHVLMRATGGGYSMDGDYDHIRYWADEIAKPMNATRPDNVAFLFVAYSLVPFATYPTQIHEAAAALDYVISELRRSPSDVSIAGDSAGGSLCLALLSTLLRPHPDMPQITVEKPLKSMILVGPWLSFRMDYPSMVRNAKKDILTVCSETKWAKNWLDGKVSTPYAEPLNAEASWWEGAEDKVSRVLCTGGSDELLFDHMPLWAEKYKSVTPAQHFEMVIGEHEGHIAPIIEPFLGDKSPTQQGNAIRAFFDTNFAP